MLYKKTPLVMYGGWQAPTHVLRIDKSNKRIKALKLPLLYGTYFRVTNS